MKKIIVIAVVVVLIVAVIVISRKSNAKQVVIYSSAVETLTNVTVDAVKKQFPDLKVNVVQISSGKLIARVLNEGNNSGDILIGVPSRFSQQLKANDLILPVTPTVEYLEMFDDPDNQIIPMLIWAGVFIINTNELEKANLPMPTRFSELTDPIYKGYMATPNPATSGTGYGLMYAFADDPDYLREVKANMKLFSDSGSGPTKMVLSGEIPIGLGIDYDAIRIAMERDYIKVVFPEEGSSYDHDAIMLVKKDNIPDHVREVMDFLISRDMYDVYIENAYVPVTKYQRITNPYYPADFRLMDMEGVSDSDRYKEFIELWESL